MATSDGQRKWIREHVPGRSFADIGGMYQLMGDVAFLAEAAGASAVTLFDVGDPDLIAAGHPEWGWFEQKKAERDSKVRYVQGDLEDPESVRRLGPHDIVYYSGVLYHTPNPFQQLAHLRQVTRELALIATITIPEVPGFDQACVFYPYLDERAPRLSHGGTRRPTACWRSALRSTTAPCTGTATAGGASPVPLSSPCCAPPASRSSAVRGARVVRTTRRWWHGPFRWTRRSHRSRTSTSTVMPSRAARGASRSTPGTTCCTTRDAVE